ncbi:YlxR family protein [Nigerium massiliense]|uniref:YlxR family protein n=1 Tax=Nigerium massiliense TaxID=1522317 RepID=UPI0006940BC0|nr:YlxR family protein [Nigerium massiliense]
MTTTRTPERTCVGCRRRAEQSALVRIVVDGDRFAVDARRAAGGRGAYLHPGCGAKALRNRAIPRALRATVGSTVQLEALLAEVDALAGPASA